MRRSQVLGHLLTAPPVLLLQTQRSRCIGGYGQHRAQGPGAVSKYRLGSLRQRLSVIDREVLPSLLGALAGGLHPVWDWEMGDLSVPAP